MEVRMKEKIKSVLPAGIVYKVKQIKFYFRMKKIYKYDFEKFKAGYAIDLEDATKEKLDSQLIFFSHAIEKGLSHKELRTKFGMIPLTELSKCLNEYNRRNLSKENIRYKVALSAIKNYQLVHIDRGVEIDFLEGIFSKEILNEVKQINEVFSGVINVKREDKLRNNEKNFESLSKERTSVREFSKEPVPLEKIEKAITIALKSPSVCNRQPSRISIIRDKEQMETILKIQGGYKGYSMPDKLLLITASNSAFISPNERNEGFIDGGLFSMSLLYALEYKGLAACALNAMMDVNDEKKVKSILQIPKEESLIMFIAVGNFQEDILSPKSYRDNVADIMRML